MERRAREPFALSVLSFECERGGRGENKYFSFARRFHREEKITVNQLEICVRKSRKKLIKMI